MNKEIRKIIHFLIKNYFISIIILCVVFVGTVSLYKLFFSKPTYIYVRVKVGQGLWWASTERPDSWLLNAIKKGKEELGLTGQTLAQIISVNYYPMYDTNQFDVYITAKLKVTHVGETGKFSFKRSTIGIGSPIDFEFSDVQFSGTISKISKTPIQEKLVTKNIFIVKEFAYPWEYDAIKIGDTYNDGSREVVRVLDKSYSESNPILVSGGNGVIYPGLRNNIMVKLRITCIENNNKIVYGENQTIVPGKYINIGVSGFTFTNFIITKIE